MPAETSSKPTVEEFATRFRGEMIPITNSFAYFSAVPLAEEDVKQYLQDPIAALPPSICALLPRIGIALVPYIERANGKPSGAGRAHDSVSFDKPAENRQASVSRLALDKEVTLVFATRDEAVADYHYVFYNEISSLVTEHWPRESQERFTRLLREELRSEVHGEVDDRSWHLKQSLLRRQTNIRKESKLFRDYARQAFADTLTLYLHGT
ncbi:MAG: hypothetical protein FJW37_08710, partial [Acidobacteria bacterium]|nr:hypothetical protein [Acidobacteriota bacterium]